MKMIKHKSRTLCSCWRSSEEKEAAPWPVPPAAQALLMRSIQLQQAEQLMTQLQVKKASLVFHWR